MKAKQQKTINKIEEYISPKWNSKFRKYYDYFFANVEFDPDGESGEKAFFDHSSRGITPKKCSNPHRYADLMWGLRWMTWHSNQPDITLTKEDLKIMNLNG